MLSHDHYLSDTAGIPSRNRTYHGLVGMDIDIKCPRPIRQAASINAIYLMDIVEAEDNLLRGSDEDEALGQTQFRGDLDISSDLESLPFANSPEIEKSLPYWHEAEEEEWDGIIPFTTSPESFDSSLPEPRRCRAKNSSFFCRGKSASLSPAPSSSYSISLYL